MAEQRFHPTRHFNAIGVAEPCLRVADGDTVVTDTIDASALDAREVTVANRPNPMTGPFYIESAEPGDTLTVLIDRLTPSRATGWTYSPLTLTVTLSRIYACPIARLGCLAFEGQRAFAPQR
jgi:amidase